MLRLVRTIGFMIGLVSSGQMAGSVELQPIVDSCAYGYAKVVTVGNLKKRGWRQIQDGEFDGFAPMLADHYLHEPFDNPFWPLKPKDSREVLTEKIVAMREVYLDPTGGYSILVNSTESGSFISINAGRPNGGATSPPSCVLYSTEQSFSDAELESLVGTSPKRPTSLGYKQTSLVRDQGTGKVLSELVAQVAENLENTIRKDSTMHAKLILEISAFKQKQ